MKKISIAIKQLHCGIRYVPNSSWLILVVAIALGMIGYLFTQMKEVGTALQNIGASMAAAAVFYFFLNFLPESRQFYQEAYKLADMYRKLQLLIRWLDDFFIFPYQKINGVKDEDIGKMTVEEFFMSKNLEEALRNFSFYNEPSKAHWFNENGKDLGVIPFKDYSLSNWLKIVDYANEIVSENGNLNWDELNHNIRFLINESAVSIFFRLQKNCRCSYKNILYVIDSNGIKNMETVRKIVGLHKMGDEIYNRLKQDIRFQVYPISQFKK